MRPCSIVFTIFIAFAGPAAAEAPSKLEEKIDAVVKTAGITDATPGVAVVAVENGKVIFQKCYGLANLEREDSNPL